MEYLERFQSFYQDFFSHERRQMLMQEVCKLNWYSFYEFKAKLNQQIHTIVKLKQGTG